jgi:hypothetical protein
MDQRGRVGEPIDELTARGASICPTAISTRRHDEPVVATKDEENNTATPRFLKPCQAS